jgi:hypothetical protein
MAAGTIRRRRYERQSLLGGKTAGELDIEAGDFSVGPGKVERRTRANEDDQFLRLLRRRQGPGTLNVREQGNGNRDGEARQEQ